jgi:hypothetical protein
MENHFARLEERLQKDLDVSTLFRTKNLVGF